MLKIGQLELKIGQLELQIGLLELHHKTRAQQDQLAYSSYKTSSRIAPRGCARRDANPPPLFSLDANPPPLFSAASSLLFSAALLALFSLQNPSFQKLSARAEALELSLP